MTAVKFRVKIINETILDCDSIDEAKKFADILESRNAISRFVNNITYTYSEIERAD